jgi:cytoskeleton protein RodZ
MPDRLPGGFGAKLREARERRGVSLRQIANATKISIAALEALERNDISRLPGGIFSRAFVRSYAVEVGLDPEATIQEFIAQFPNDSVIAGHPTSDQVEDHQAVESERRTATAFLWLAVVSVPLAAAVYYFATSGRPQLPGLVPPSSSEPTRPAEPPRVGDLPPPAPAPPPAATSEPAAAGAASGAAPAGASPGPAGPAGASPAPAKAGTSSPAASAPATSTPGASTPATSRPGTSAAPAAAASAPSDHLSVQMSASRPCWVSATVDGKRQIERLLLPGEKTTVEVRQEIVLTAGDAAALALTLNGEDARPLGKSGEVVTVRLNLANFRTHLQTR